MQIDKSEARLGQVAAWHPLDLRGQSSTHWTHYSPFVEVVGPRAREDADGLAFRVVVQADRTDAVLCPVHSFAVFGRR